MPAKSPVIRLRHILVPVDFSPLLHVIEPAMYPSEMGVVLPVITITTAAARKQLAAFAKKFIPGELQGKIVVRNGQPYFEIAEVARQLRVDLLALTTHGYSGLKRMLLGGTAERVIRYAPCPVLIVRIR